MGNLSAPSRSAKQAEPGDVRTHWPARLTSCVCRVSLDMANMRTRTPGRPSGVLFPGRSPSIPASAPQPITEVANPVIVVAACSAQRRLGAVIRIAVPRIGKASAKLSSMRTPFLFIGRMRPPRKHRHAEADAPSPRTNRANCRSDDRNIQQGGGRWPCHSQE